MIEAQFVSEFPTLLFNRPVAAGERREIERCRGHQIQVTGRQPRAPVRDQRTRRGHLAIADLARRSADLPLGPDRVRAVLRERRAIDRQHARPHRRPELGPDSGAVPRRMRYEMLQRWLGDRTS
jgi:hypothetical protein